MLRIVRECNLSDGCLFPIEEENVDIDKSVLTEDDLKKLEYLGNPRMMELVEKYVKLMKPAKVTVITDDQKDIDYVRQLAIKNGEEKPLAIKGHTVHYDGYNDQARDKAATKVLKTADMKMSSVINTIDREEGYNEVHEIMDGIMKGKECLVRFFCLGPTDSRFAISALQLTDSSYVGHSEDILYRTGYEQFRKLNGSSDFFAFFHSAGELDERGVTKNVAKRRVYIDVTKYQVYTVNNQYAGNSLGLKKLALRLAIYKANREDWLTEHMFIMGLKPLDKDRITYFTGAYPSACGKTSTAMVPGMTIVGDDIAYIRKDDRGRPMTVNIEQGIFGIITDVNPEDDPVIYKTLTTPREQIFSNILTNDKGEAFWLNMGRDLPDEGYNHWGKWKKGMKDDKGNEIGHCHKNSRYTVPIADLENVDPNLHNPDGVPIQGVIYGGRDSDTSVPVYQSLDWAHGVAIGATLESETTSATLGQEGVRTFSPMANLDFLVVPLGLYIKNHLKFGDGLSATPLVFATNYFLKDKAGKYVDDKIDKKVWLLWMEGRVHGEYDAVETPIGYVPKYEDLRDLFKRVFDEDYDKARYDGEFGIRTDKWLAKLDRMKDVYAKEEDIPKEFTDTLAMLRQRLEAAREKHGKDEIPAEAFA
jgi:phosphoenolpyruvate carboxykinase (GTP)